MKKFWRIFLCVLVVLLLGSSAFMLYRTIDNNEKGSDEIILDEGETNFDPPATDNEDIELKHPENLSDLMCLELSMVNGCQMYIGEGELENPVKIRFLCLAENSLVESVNKNPKQQLGMIIAPLDAFEAVNSQGLTYIDWIKEFDAAGRNLVVQTFDNISPGEEGYTIMNMVLDGISFENMNRKYVSIGVLIDSSSGENVYKYAQLGLEDTYRDYARSAAYVIGGSMNGHVMGTYPVTDEQYLLMQHYMDLAVDSAIGLSEPTANLDMPRVTIPKGTDLMLGVNMPYKLDIQIEPEKLDIPIFYKSLDTNIATVSEDGVITTKSTTGLTTVEAYVAGQVYEFQVRVTHEVEFA